MNSTEIENALRRAPTPKPPAILRQQLQAQALRAPRIGTAHRVAPRPTGSWLSRWWPALAPAAVSLACAAVISMQKAEIQKLKQTASSAARNVSSGKFSANTPVDGNNQAVTTPAISEQAEVERLKNLAANLSANVSKLEQMRADNEKLRRQITSASAPVFSAEETQAMEQARERAMRIQCVNQLKQLGLAARLWALDNGDINPPTFLSMSNEIGSFKILVCPADNGRQAAKDPSSYSAANCSYEFLAPSSPETEPTRVLFRCPIHGSVCLVDGSVQSETAKKHPEQLVQRDGKLYFQTAEPNQ